MHVLQIVREATLNAIKPQKVRWLGITANAEGEYEILGAE